MPIVIYSECSYAECHYGECHGAHSMAFICCLTARNHGNDVLPKVLAGSVSTSSSAGKTDKIESLKMLNAL